MAGQSAAKRRRCRQGPYPQWMGADMGRQISRRTAFKVNALKVKGLYPDGIGLYLQISATAFKSCIFRFKAHGRTRDTSHGS